MTITKSNSSWSLVSWPTPLLKRKRKSNTEALKTHRYSGEINKQDSQGRSLLFYAARYDQPEVAIQLLGAGCDPNMGDNDSNTPLHQAVLSGSIDVAKVLIKEGCCDVNAKNKDGLTPLMSAVQNDELELVKLILKSGAKVNEIDQLGRSALLIGLCWGSERSCLHLLKCGCDVNIIDKEGHTALFYATYDTELTVLDVAKKLIRSGYNAKRDTEWLKEAGESQQCLFQKDKKFFKKVLSKAGIKDKKDHSSEDVCVLKLTYLHKVFLPRSS